MPMLHLSNYKKKKFKMETMKNSKNVSEEIFVRHHN